MAVKPWDQEHTYAKTVEVIADLSTRHASRISNEALRTDLEKAIREKRYCDLVGWDLSYCSDLSAADLIEARQALGFFQKLEPLDIGIDKEEAARTKFLQAEDLCRETNRLFAQWTSGAFCFPKGVDGILYAASRKISKVLGRLPALSELDMSFGPGATTSVPRRKSCSRVKLSSSLSCSSNFLEILPSVMEELPAWFNNQVDSFEIALDNGSFDSYELVERHTVEIHDGKVAFVPKNAKTYRTVMTEPTLNTVVQGGYGRWIADRLRRIGQSTKDQSRNQRLARMGSLTGELATLDLSSASDTISRELVAHLLPFDWFSALDSCRTKRATDGDRFIDLEKFSSMGNGFTFPLQTLIFWALVSSCTSPDATVSVYGDDIICPVECVPAVMQVFNCCGFILNKDKSYWEGPFRESCGADYYLGVNIRPFYLKSLISYEVLFILHNHYVRNYDSDQAQYVLGLIPEEYRIWGPDGYGDGHLIGGWKPIHHKRDDGWGGFLFDTFTKIGRTHTRVLPGDRVLPAYSIYVKGECSDTRPLRIGKDGILRDPLPGTKGYKRTTVYTLTCA